MTTTYPSYRGLRFEEDIALEQKFAGLTVPKVGGNGSLNVAVTWRLPDRELVKVQYPYVLLDFLGLFPRRNEEVRGTVVFGTEPYSGNYLDQGAFGEFPVPITLRYQATTNTRVMQHDVIINDIISTSIFPMRYGQLNCPSGTVRRLDFESMTPADTIDNEEHQKLYRKIWTVSVSAEWVPGYWNSEPVTEVDIIVKDGATPNATVDAELVANPPGEWDESGWDQSSWEDK